VDQLDSIALVADKVLGTQNKIVELAQKTLQS
jgi:hypothetical protein